MKTLTITYILGVRHSTVSKQSMLKLLKVANNSLIIIVHGLKLDFCFTRLIKYVLTTFLKPTIISKLYTKQFNIYSWYKIFLSTSKYNKIKFHLKHLYDLVLHRLLWNST